jgi:hypothetical protein
MFRSAFLSILLAVMLAAPAAVFGQETATAGDEAAKPGDHIKLTGATEVKLGEKQTFDVEVKPPADVIGFNCRIAYDPDNVKIGKITRADAEELGSALVLPKDTGGFVDLTAAMPGQKWTYTGKVFSVEYTPISKGKISFEFYFEEPTEKEHEPYKPAWSGMDGRTLIDIGTLEGLTVTSK